VSEVGRRVEQVDQARLAHIRGNELGSEFNGIDEKSQITRGGSTKTDLLGEDVSRQGTTNCQGRLTRWVETENAPSEGKDLCTGS
jgi:hypothetical protein